MHELHQWIEEQLFQPSLEEQPVIKVEVRESSKIGKGS